MIAGAAALAERPPSVTEWEELLVRFEVMPRALRVTLEEAEDRDGEAALAALRAAAAREEAALRWLVAASGVPVDAPPSAGGDAVALADRLSSLRTRNFAMLQRRGLEVWDWTAPLDGEPVTAYQLVQALVRDDADTLAGLRGGRPLGGRRC